MMHPAVMTLDMQQWRDARTAAEDAADALRQALAALGVPARCYRQVRPVVTPSGKSYVLMGPLPVDLAAHMSEALGRDLPPKP